MDTRDFNAALNGHAIWIERFTEAMSGNRSETFAPELIRDHESCILGRWIAAHPDLYNNPELYGTVTALHQTIHEITAEIAEMIDGGTTPEIIATYLDALDSLLRELAAFQLDHKNSILTETS